MVPSKSKIKTGLRLVVGTTSLYQANFTIQANYARLIAMLSGFILLLTVGFLAAVPAQAQFATSENFDLEIGDYLGEGEGLLTLSSQHNSGTEIPDGTYGINTTYADFLDDLEGIYQGFPNAASASSQIRISVDALQVHFGSLTPGILQNQETQIQFDSNLPLGYSLYLGQDQNLTLADYYQNNLPAPGNRSEIAATRCDDGTCTPTQAAVWENPDVPGFGYTVSGTDMLPDFTGGKYRPFVNLNQVGTVPVLVAQRANLGQILYQQKLRLRYQVGVAPNNEAGLYANRISLTVVPQF
jgi:hypothetical protein